MHVILLTIKGYKMADILKVDELVLHEVAKQTPVMSPEQFDALVESIDMNGQLEPITVYKMKIVDGRHRWKALQKLGVPIIKADKLPANTTEQELQDLVLHKETRRHETASQLAIRAYRLSTTDSYTQAGAAKAVGANPKRVSEAKKIAVTYGRNDLLELIHNGKKFNTGSKIVPFWTDSLGTILRWLAENAELPVEQPRVEYRKELSDGEQALANHYYTALMRESTLVRGEVSALLLQNTLGDE